jgi:hypothetical protein
MLCRQLLTIWVVTVFPCWFNYWTTRLWTKPLRLLSTCRIAKQARSTILKSTIYRKESTSCHSLWLLLKLLGANRPVNFNKVMNYSEDTWFVYFNGRNLILQLGNIVRGVNSDFYDLSTKHLYRAWDHKLAHNLRIPNLPEPWLQQQLKFQLHVWQNSFIHFKLKNRQLQRVYISLRSRAEPYRYLYTYCSGLSGWQVSKLDSLDWNFWPVQASDFSYRFSTN